jgi:hypothetical protein
MYKRLHQPGLAAIRHPTTAILATSPDDLQEAVALHTKQLLGAAPPPLPPTNPGKRPVYGRTLNRGGRPSTRQLRPDWPRQQTLSHSSTLQSRPAPLGWTASSTQPSSSSSRRTPRRASSRSRQTPHQAQMPH